MFDPTLATYFTYMIEGLIVLMVSTDVITLKLLKGGRRIGVSWRPKPRKQPKQPTPTPTGGGGS